VPVLKCQGAGAYKRVVNGMRAPGKRSVRLADLKRGSSLMKLAGRKEESRYEWA